MQDAVVSGTCLQLKHSAYSAKAERLTVAYYPQIPLRSANLLTFQQQMPEQCRAAQMEVDLSVLHDRSEQLDKCVFEEISSGRSAPL